MEELTIMHNLLMEVGVLIKDSDAVKEKEMLAFFMEKICEPTTIMAIGNEQTGKTSLLDQLFAGSILQGRDALPTLGMIENLYGAEDLDFQADKGHVRRFITRENLQGLSVVDTQGLDTIQDKKLLQKMQERAVKSDALLVFFDADSVNSLAAWNFLEGMKKKNITFIMTKCDMADESRVRANKDRLKQYASEAGIEATIFCVYGQKQISTELLTYVKEYVIGSNNPVLTKQREGLGVIKELLSEMGSSFALRKKQFEADYAILQKMNQVIDTFCNKNQLVMEGLQEELRSEINKEIDSYENEIIAKLNPHKIKENFISGNGDFLDYLTLINEAYKKRMNQNVSRSTQNAVRNYLFELENVFEEATGYFKSRESLLTLEDKFYGSLAANKNEMLGQAEKMLVTSQDFYRSLSDASEELFMKIWEARNQYDMKTMSAEFVGASIGAGAGAGGIIMTGLATGMWPIIGAIVGGILLAHIAKELMTAKSANDMEKKVKECISEFKMEISKTRTEMTGQILTTIEAIFKRELVTVDKTFMEFRMSVNIEGKNIPQLEDKMEKVQTLMQNIRALEGELLEC